MVRCAQVELKELVANTLDQHLAPIRTEMQRILQDTGYLGTARQSINQTIMPLVFTTESNLTNELWFPILFYLYCSTHKPFLLTVTSSFN